MELVRRLNPTMTFPEAARLLADGTAPPLGPRPRPQPRPLDQPEARPEGWDESAAALVADAERRLWMPEGADALAYLRGRGLTDATIQAARLGVIVQGRLGIPSGIAVPWFDGPALSMVNVRRPEGQSPKYLAIKGSRRGGIYPGRNAILPGRPVVIVEGELDSLLLGQVLADLAAVVTIGSASVRPSTAILGALLAASPWLLATDADPAGDGAADSWPASPRCRRVRPPGDHKDWTEVHQAGVNLRRWWQDILGGNLRPQLFTWEELATWRWGPALDDPEPGIIKG